MKLSSGNSNWKIKYMVAYHNQCHVITNSNTLSSINPLEFCVSGMGSVDEHSRYHFKMNILKSKLTGR